MKKLRPLGEITADLEPLLLEMAIDHDLQHGEILNLIRGYLEIHVPDQREEYEDNTVPIFYYGHRENHERSRKPKRKV